jgi:2-polyprenyl-3-methyl-5-hydroxy-6-metoxy-1,4-benzoquinol methylase
MTFDAETQRDRYFAVRDRELAALVDPATGRIAADLVHMVDCPLCGSSRCTALFVKNGFSFVRCDECGLVYVNPQLDEHVVLDQYRSAETSDLWFDVLTSPRQQELDRAKFSHVLEHLEPYRRDGRILDVGCSIGLFLDLARQRGWHGIGIELAARAREYARTVHDLEVLDVPLAEASIEAEAFDAVTLLSVLEHANDPRALLSECARVLRPGGGLYVIVPNVESLACRVLRERARSFDGRNHLVYFSRSTLDAMLERTGFATRSATTEVSSLEPVLEYLAVGEPYVDADLARDAVASWVSEHRREIELRVVELGLGYKLHCVADKRPSA